MVYTPYPSQRSFGMDEKAGRTIKRQELYQKLEL
jgi:hypothetical protein